MKNCIILGSGRSGTSMVAGCLRNAGYYMGERMKGPTEINPLGYFESVEINDINEDLLRHALGCSRRRLAARLVPAFRHPVLTQDQHWLAVWPVGRRIPCSPAQLERIRAQVERQPYCFKDPRFCYTLPAWRPHLGNTVLVCVFREPARTVNSILTDCRKSSYLAGIRMTPERALRVWSRMYEHVLKIHRHAGDWLFVHYDQVLDGSGLTRLEQKLSAGVDKDFPRASLKRSQAAGPVTRRAARLYGKLCELAGYPAGGN